MYPDKLSPGYGIFVKNVVDELSKRGIRIKCSSLIKGRSRNLLSKVIKYLKFYLSIIIGFFKKYDLIYIHFPNQALPILLPLLALRKRRVIINLHGEDLLYCGFLGSFLGKLNDFFLTKAEKIIVPSDYFKQEVIKRCFCTEDKIHISPSGGIDNQLFYPIKNSSIKNKFYIGYVGRIEEEKGIKEFIEVLFLLNKHINCEAIIIGYGPFEQKLTILVNRLLLTNKVTFIKGLEQERLNEYFNLFDLFLFLSKRRAESLGLVGIEAMACGTPVIGTDNGGIPSYLIDGYNGFLVPKGDINSTFESVLRYHSLNKREKDKMKINCIETSKSYFKDKVSKELSEVFYSVIKTESGF